LHFSRLTLDMGMNELALMCDSGDKEIDWFQWTHSNDLVVISLVTHKDSIICLKIIMNEACLLTLLLANLKILLLPSLADPADILKVDGLVCPMDMVIFDDINGIDPLDKSCPNGYRNIPVLFSNGVKVSFEINKTQIAFNIPYVP
jgi:hypothetical protein